MSKIKVGVTISDVGGPRKIEVDAYATKSPFLAVHKSLDALTLHVDCSWTVTHIPTGYYVKHLARKKDAMGLANELSPWQGESGESKDYSPEAVVAMKAAYLRER